MKKVLILDENESDHNELHQLLIDNFSVEIHHLFNPDEAIQLCKEQAFNLIIVDPMLPSSLDGERFIENQRQFYSINKDTPIIILTEDIEFVSRITKEYGLHPEAKSGSLTKVLNPIKIYLKD